MDLISLTEICLISELCWTDKGSQRGPRVWFGLGLGGLLSRRGVFVEGRDTCAAGSEG